jgi:hypothetical protein
MPTDKLNTANLQRRFESLVAKAREGVQELDELGKRRDKLLSKMCGLLGDLELLFKQKPVDYQFREGRRYWKRFDELVEDLVKPLTGFGLRQTWHLVHIRRNLYGKITNEELNSLGIERAKELSKVAEVKGTVTKGLIEQALTMTVAEVREKRRELINPRGNDMHEVRGGWATWECEGPRKFVQGIPALLGVVRKEKGHGPSDAEIVYDLLNAYVAELQGAEAERRKTIANLDKVVELTEKVSE